jgi:hypothetical protein
MFLRERVETEFTQRAQREIKKTQRAQREKQVFLSVLGEFLAVFARNVGSGKGCKEKVKNAESAKGKTSFSWRAWRILGGLCEKQMEFTQRAQRKSYKRREPKKE